MKWKGMAIQKKRKWLRRLAIFAFVLMALAFGSSTVRAIFPEYLKNGRTYDQERNYIQWNGSVAYINLYHKDNTSLPASEGGTYCGNGCTEQVTRIEDGSSISGNFTYLQTFNVQVAYSGDSNVGSAIIRACGQVIRNEDLYIPNQGTPGFNNLPSPAWNVPTAGDCTWSITASGGYVDFRAVTTVYRTTPAPTVDLKVNSSNGPLNVGAPGSYTLSWTSTNAASCSASGSWSGAQATNSSQAYSNVAAGAYTYSITCTNPAGSATDSVTVNVLSVPTVSVSAPAAVTAPASYTATWTSSNATSCTGSSRFNTLTGLTGSKAETNLPVGSYDYTVTCTNAVGAIASDTKRTVVYAAPFVDLKVDGSDGPALTRTGPASYSASWTSSNATQCIGSSRLAGYSGLLGSRAETNIPAGTTYDYTVTCQNAAGTTVSDTIRMIVVAAPTVDVRVNGSNGPLTFTEPASYTVTWSSTNATACSALNNLSGPIGTSGSTAFSNVVQAVYRYTVQCDNAAGTTASDTVMVTVNPPPPTVDLKINDGNGPVTLVAPGAYTLTWTSQNAASCSASSTDGMWSGSQIANSSKALTNIGVGVRTYSITCTNVSGSTTDSVTANVIAPLTGTISILYSKLLLFGPAMGTPAQVVNGTVSGGEAPYQTTVVVRSPYGVQTTFRLSGASWSLDSVVSGDPNLGVSEKGTWSARAEIRDAGGRLFQTNSVTWEVSWYPVHGRP